MSELSKYAGNARKVIKTDSSGNDTVYASVGQAAEDNHIAVQTMRRWAHDGKEYRGYTYSYQKKPDFVLPVREKVGKDSFQRPPYMGVYRGVAT